MVVVRIIYPEYEGDKLMRIMDIGEGQLITPPGCTVINSEDWANLISGCPGETPEEQEEYLIYTQLAVTIVQDLR
jgi:hypothetical protein